MKRVLITVLAAILTAIPSVAGNPVLKIEGGKVCGIPAEEGITIYKGIPYAAPPVGENRWRAPQPVLPWKGILQADTFGPASVQVNHTDEGGYTAEFFFNGDAPFSEDCLYLNVWTPAAGKKNAKLPVALWIHGGGYIGGWGYEPEMDGLEWAKHGVILVSINYRLGVAGFLAHPLLSEESPEQVSGNYGMLDQIAALKWIRNNIRQFGGDPESITVMGQSAGAISVQTLVTSPLSKGLIDKAIIQSGGGIHLEPERSAKTLSEAETTGKAFMDWAKCTTLEQMRSLPADQLFPMGIRFLMDKGQMVNTAPVLDGYAYPQNFSEAAVAGEIADIPYMIGCTHDDMNVLNSGIGDFCFVREKDGTPAYAYEFARPLPSDGRKGALEGSFHSSELWYTFKSLRNSWRPFTSGDYDLSEQMITAWTNFAKTGNPGGAWNPCTLEKPQWMVFKLGGADNVASEMEALPQFGKVKEENPVALTLTGKVLGENRDGVAIFRGIPYGGPCDGENRFKAPIAPKAWEGVRDCTKNGPYAIQNGTSISGSPGRMGRYFNGGHPELFGVENEKQGENCLVLNVLTPGIDEAERPVLVYLHGGGFSTGSGTLVLGADRLAREENLVIVGVNHRLNVFGYLYLGGFDPEYADSGTAGMMDLVLALEWVRDNIASFGGDPAKVTIMGESGGCMKVNTLMTMEKAAGLFRGAIAESGSTVVGNYPPEKAMVQTRKLLEKLGIAEEDWRQILDVPADELLAAAQGLSFSPVADDINLKYVPGDAYTAPAISKDIPLMVGSSADEMGIFMPLGKLEVTKDNLRDYAISASPLITEENADVVLAAFEAINKKGDEPWHTYVKINSLAGVLGGGAEYQATVKASQGGAPVYHYLVEYDVPGVIYPEYSCSWHTADLPLQFRIVADPASEQLSRIYARAWSAFVRTGNPSTPELPWPAFDNETRQVMVFDTDTRVETDPLKPILDVLK